MTGQPPARICALVLMGVSGSGKTAIGEALAQRLGWRFADGDVFHPPSNVEKMRSGHPLTDDDRWPWLRAIAAEIARVRADGGHVVIACSALKRAYRDMLIDGKPDVTLIYLKGDRDLILSRLKARQGHFMPPSLLESQFKVLEEPGPDEPAITVDVSGSVETIVDDIGRKLALSDQ